MSEASELLNGTDDISAYTALPETEGRIVVGNDRFITVPEGLKRIAVQHDHNIETVTFEAPRYWDDHDMSEMDVYVQYQRPDGVTGRYLCEDVWVDETDDTKMCFNWVVQGHVTTENGKLIMQVCVKNPAKGDAETEAYDINHWNSELNEDLYISKGLDCGNAFQTNDPSQAKMVVITENNKVEIVEADDGYQLRTVTIRTEIPEEETPAVAPDPTKPIRFFDYDGTLLHSYTIDELMELTTVPELPEHEGLVGQGWNVTLDVLMILRRPYDVGAIYTTDDGKTRLYISARNTLDVKLMFDQTVENDVTIDWGDGSEAELVTEANATITSSGTGVDISHTYAAAGDYVIGIGTAEGKISLSNSGYTCGIMGNTSAGPKMLRKVELGNNVIGLSDNAFSGCYALSSITIPNGDDTSDNLSTGVQVFRNCYSLKHVNIPRPYTTIGIETFAYSGIGSVTLPSTLITISSEAFYDCLSLREIVIPDSVQNIGTDAFDTDGLVRVVMPEGLAGLSSGIFDGLSISEFDFTGRTTVMPFSTGAFDVCNIETLVFKVPADMYDQWTTMYGWPSLASHIVAV